MKKILWMLFVLLILGLGFLYVVKNPSSLVSQFVLTSLNIDMTEPTVESTDLDLTNCTSYFDGCNTCMVQSGQIGGCTRMFCETPAEPQCLEYLWTGMDLSTCTSYFDGCNNCSVENGRPSACTEMYCETPSEPKCNEYTNTGIDLTNCISYFDGCNNCTVENGKPSACTLMYCETPEEPKCNEYATGTDIINEINTDATTGTDTINEINTGSEGIACTMEYMPVCASVEVQCIKAPCPAVEQTFGNKCTMNANKTAFFLHDGECGK